MTAPCPRCGASSDEGGWCGCCGNDLRPGSSAGRFSRTAQEREALWQEDPEAARSAFRARSGPTEVAPEPEAPGTKVCPRCAEDVKAAAQVCRFCGHEFGGAKPATPRRWGESASPTQTSALAVGAYAVAREGNFWTAFRLAKEARAEIAASDGRLTGLELVESAEQRAWFSVGALVLVLVLGVAILATQT